MASFSWQILYSLRNVFTANLSISTMFWLAMSWNEQRTHSAVTHPIYQRWISNTCLMTRWLVRTVGTDAPIWPNQAALEDAHYCVVSERTDLKILLILPSSPRIHPPPASPLSPPLKACGDPGMCKMGGKWIAWPLELLSPLQQAALPVLSQQCAHSIRLMDSAGI